MYWKVFLSNCLAPQTEVRRTNSWLCSFLLFSVKAQRECVVVLESLLFLDVFEHLCIASQDFHTKHFIWIEWKHAPCFLIDSALVLL